MANDPVPTKTSKEVVEQFLENQAKELAIRAQELEFEKQKDTNGFEFSKEALAAQERDRIHERECSRGQRKDSHRLVIWIVAIVAAVLFGAIYLGQSEVALEIAKGIGIFLAGAFGGFGYAKTKSDKDDSST